MDNLVPARSPKKVAVIGGGVAGMECARIAAQRGHDVTIYESGSKLGGTFLAASVAKSKTRNAACSPGTSCSSRRPESMWSITPPSPSPTWRSSTATR